jgi:hypothetical protein
MTSASEGSTAGSMVGLFVPETVEVAVLGSDEAVLAETTAAPEWVRVGGSEQCGGPHQATVTVPAP